MVRYHLNHKLVDWENDESYIFTNPKLGKVDQQLIKINKIPNEPSMVWVGSSGTTSKRSYKLVGLKKSAFLASAESVCKHLQVTDKDIWLNVLPRFHVGGLSIEARSHVSGCLVVQHKEPHFSLKSFNKAITHYQVTITSLVPTQVYEIVKNKLPVPTSLRAVLVGGGNLNEQLYKEAISLGWPLVLTYGMTELCSQIATSRPQDILSPEKPKAYILDHIEAKTDDQNQLLVRSKSLLFGQLIFTEEDVKFIKPEGEWFQTHDLVKISDGCIQFLGRKSSQVKISGELTNLHQLNNLLENIIHQQAHPLTATLVVSPNLKYENQIDMVVEEIVHLKISEDIKQKFNNSVAKFEAIRNIYFVDKIQRNHMGKVTISSLR